MSIMTDARLRLLEARVAEIERRLAEHGAPAPAPAAGAASITPPTTRTKRKSAPKPRKRSKKAT